MGIVRRPRIIDFMCWFISLGYRERLQCYPYIYQLLGTTSSQWHSATAIYTSTLTITITIYLIYLSTNKPIPTSTQYTPK